MFRFKGAARAALLAGGAWVALAPAQVFAQSTGVYHFDIPAEALGKALTDVGKQGQREILFSSDLTRGKRAAALSGDLTIDQALNRLLAGAGLSYRTAASGSIIITDAADPPAAVGATPTGHAEAFSDKPGGTPGLMMDVIVVTGASAAVKKFDTPYAISTISIQNIREDAPRSMVDLLRSLPGVNVENSGGEGGGENVVVRGLPWAGFRLLDVQEDGLPLFESNYERELNIDEVFRVDLNTTQVELVRGGTAPIFSNNGSGGVLNLITNHGTNGQQGEVEVTTGSNNLGRVDVASSGPITDNLLYSVGGFYRVDDGERNPGFADGDKGGQFKAALTYKFNNGDKIWADVKYLNDRGIFYTDFPLKSPIDGSSLKSLIDPNYGTLDSGSFQHVGILTLNGAGGVATLDRNLADGIHPDVKTVTVGGDFDLGDGWKITDRARYVDGYVLFNDLANGSATAAPTLLGGFLSAAKSAFPTTASLRYVYAGTNTVFNPATTAGLTMTNTWGTATNDYTDLMNAFRADKTIDAGGYGHHDLTFGLDLSYFTLREAQINSTIVTDVKTHPDLLDIQALNAAGNVVGLVTNDGFSSYGGGDLIGHVAGVSTALYGLENWHINSAWQVDAGVRHELQQASGDRGLIGADAVSSTGPLASRTITGLVGYLPYSKFLDGTSWTVGSSYTFDRLADVFVRYSSSYSLPRLSDQWGGLNNGVYGTLPNGAPIPTTKIQQAESGVKLALPKLQLSAIGFWSHFDDLNASTYVTNATGQIVNQSLLINTTTYGVEFEGAWRPASWFELTSAVTLQNPTVDKATTFSTTVSAASITGKQITRTPPYTVTLQPTWLFDFGPVNGRAYVAFFAEAKRYQDYVNDSVLPAYQSVDLGGLLNLGRGWGVDVHVYNVTNSDGLTEGNARAPLSNSLTVGDSTAGRPIFGRSFTVSLLKRW
jgi:outer membrane receptor protein involved in Fe transport